MTLPVPSPRSWDPGDIGSAPYLNSNIRDAFGFLLAPPIFVAKQDAAQSLANNTVVPLTWDHIVIDTYGGHSTSDPTKYAVPFAGVWLVYGFVAYPPNATSRRLIQIALDGTSVSQIELPNAGASANTNINIWGIWQATLGDYFQLNGFQSSGAAMNTLVASPAASYMQVHLVGRHT